MIKLLFFAKLHQLVENKYNVIVNLPHTELFETHGGLTVKLNAWLYFWSIKMAKYDTEEIELTPRFIEAIQELLEAELEMMQQQKQENAECWTWGVCEIGDLADSNGLSFEFGGDDYKPDILASSSVNVMAIEI